MAKIVFMGDSITDSFHKFHVDEAGLGNGYVALIAERLRERGRADFIRNSGHDGFTVSGLLRLFEYDCLQFHPDMVTVQIGSNDAAVEMNTGKTIEEQKFAENYRKLLGRVREETGLTLTRYRYRVCAQEVRSHEGHKVIYGEVASTDVYGREPLVVTRYCPGVIIREPRGESGFGYDPVFIPDGFDKTFAELGDETKNKISHRALAVKGIAEMLRAVIE